MNWLDFMFGLILVASVVSGFKRGMLRIAIGVVATIAAFLVASWFYGMAGGWLVPYVASRGIANFLGFLMVFAGVLSAGAVVSWIVGRMMKIVGLSWLDRVGGAAFGVVRGVVICAVLLMVVTAFSPTRSSVPVTESTLAPHVLEASRLMAAMTPYELKDGFRTTYEKVKDTWSDTLKKAEKSKKLESRRE